MDAITNFWNHFQQNNYIFRLLTEIPKEEIAKHFKELNVMLRAYNKEIDLIIKNGKNKFHLIITANGNPYLFKEVELLVHNAPVIEKWKITAFIQPAKDIEKYEKGEDKPLHYHGISLKLSELYFEQILNPSRPNDFGIKVYLKNFIVLKNNPKLREAIYLHIEHLIGEKAFANEIIFIAVAQLTDYENLIELYNLSSYIRNLKNVFP